MAWPYLVMKQNVIYVLIIIKNLHNSKCSHGAGCTLFMCDGQYIIIFEYRLLIIISKQLIMRLPSVSSPRWAGLGSSLTLGMNPPSGGEVRNRAECELTEGNLQLKQTVSRHKKSYLLYA